MNDVFDLNQFVIMAKGHSFDDFKNLWPQTRFQIISFGQSKAQFILDIKYQLVWQFRCKSKIKINIYLTRHSGDGTNSNGHSFQNYYF